MVYITYSESNKPILEKREEQHLIFLRNLSVATQRVVTEHKSKLDYPSYRIAQDLLLIECIDAEEMPRPADQPVGNLKHGHLITDKGRQLLQQLEQFVDGQLVTDDMTLLLDYWSTFSESRYAQYMVNVGLVGVENDLIVKLTRMYDDNPQCLGIHDVLTGYGSPEIETNLQLNPHMSNEKKGGNLQARITGYDAHCLKLIKDHTGLSKDTEIITYLLTVGLAVILKQQQVTGS